MHACMHACHMRTNRRQDTCVLRITGAFEAGLAADLLVLIGAVPVAAIGTSMLLSE